MGENLEKISDEQLKEIAGGANSSTFVSKFKVKDHVRSLSRPDLGVGMIVHMGRRGDGTVIYAVNFGDEGLTLPEDDLVLAY